MTAVGGRPGDGLRDAVVVVTGAGRMRSIGRSIALAFAAAGSHVAVTGTGRGPERMDAAERDTNWRDVESVADEIRALGLRALPLTLDVTDEASVATALDRVSADLGPIDICINNAAAARGADRVPVADLELSVWEQVLAVNLTGTFLVSRDVTRRWLADRRPGAIVNISSVAGKLGPPRMAAYGASKAAVQSLTVSMARELAEDGIRVNAVLPGVVNTSRIDDVDAEGWAAYLRTAVPMGRAGEPEDIAEAVLFLASARAGWVTGQCWNIDGGQVTMR